MIVKRLVCGVIVAYLCVNFPTLPSFANEGYVDISQQTEVLDQVDLNSSWKLILDGDSGNIIRMEPLRESSSVYLTKLQTCLYGDHVFCFDKTTSGKWPSIAFWAVGLHASQITWIKGGVTHVSPKVNPGLRVEIRNAPVTVTKVKIW